MPSPSLPQPRRRRRVIMALVACAMMLSLLYPLRQYGASKAQLRALVRQEQQIEAQTRSLLEQKKRLTSAAEIERQAREHLHMVRPGEVAFAITGSDPTPAASAAPAKAAPKKKTPWYRSFWRWITGG